MSDITLAGIFMYRDIELIKFDIEDGCTNKFELLTSDTSKFPPELKKNPSSHVLVDLLKFRVVPSTRQRINEDLRAVGIPYYDISAILKHQNASTCDDPFWVKFDGEGPQTWAELRKKIGYET